MHSSDVDEEEEDEDESTLWTQPLNMCKAIKRMKRWGECDIPCWLSLFVGFQEEEKKKSSIAGLVDEELVKKEVMMVMEMME